MDQTLTPLLAERRAFKLTLADGLWDVLIGTILLIFAAAPLLSETMGDFWSSFIFLPFWGFVYLTIRLIRRHVITPRLGNVTFAASRRRKLLWFTLTMLAINLFLLILGVLALLYFQNISGYIFQFILGLIFLLSFSSAAYLLDHPRLFMYGLLLLATPILGEWLYATHGFSHHGYPIVFTIASGAIIFTGLFTFFRFLAWNPYIEIPAGE